MPGRDVGLEMILTKAEDGTTGVVLPYRATGTATDGTPVIRQLTSFFVALGAIGGSRDTDFSVELRGIEGATILIAKSDPGQGLVWLAFGSLIAGLRHHVLPAPAADLGAAAAGRKSSRSSAGRIGTSTSTGSSGASSTTWWRRGNRAADGQPA